VIPCRRLAQEKRQQLRSAEQSFRQDTARELAQIEQRHAEEAAEYVLICCTRTARRYQSPLNLTHTHHSLIDSQSSRQPDAAVARGSFKAVE